MIARYEGTCADCGGAIQQGDEITRAGRRWAHAECPARSYKQIHGRCEDAPCCGCCGETGYGYATLITAY